MKLTSKGAFKVLFDNDANFRRHQRFAERVIVVHRD